MIPQQFSKMDNQEPINFYRKNTSYGQFSNFYPSPFKVGDTVYPTNEHYFQSKKFEGHPYEKEVASSKTPKQSFDKGRSREHPLRKDWQEVKQSIMYEGLRHKFSQNENLRVKLMQTGKRKLVEHTDRDKYWGDGGNGKGENRLGILLMKLRDELKNKQ